jgi:hypothetical protein
LPQRGEVGIIARSQPENERIKPAFWRRHVIGNGAEAHDDEA